jgi:uncharacterized membrane protein YfcA
VARLGVPGAIGAFLGVTPLSALSTEDAAPYMAGVLLALGVYICCAPPSARRASRPPASRRTATASCPRSAWSPASSTPRAVAAGAPWRRPRC